MNKKIFVLSAVALTSFMTLVGCNSNKVVRNSDELYVCVYDGGYGTEWIDQVAKDYENATGVKVIWEADQSILDRMTSDLENPSYDVYMSHDISWQQYAAKGLLAELDDLYEEQVGDTGKTFKQRLCDGAAEVSTFQGHYYKSCYTQGAGGLVYNIKMFEENGWTVPTTYDELKTLCQTIVDANLKTDSLTKVVPIAWSGDREYYWDYPVFEWWAQLGGLSAIDAYKAFLGPDGKNSTGYEVYNPNGMHKEFMQAYDMWYDLIAKNQSFYNSKPQDAKLTTATSLFASGAAAMIPYAQWAKWEIQNNSGITLDFDIAMMKTPRANASITTDYNYNVGFGDSIVIANKIPDESKALAKDFLKYLASPAGCKTFVDKARGAFLAFDYSIVDLGDLRNDKYIDSIYRRLTECTNFNLVSTNPIAFINAAAIMPWINNEYYYTKAVAFPDNAQYQKETVGNNIYQKAKDSWSSWMKKAGISD